MECLPRSPVSWPLAGCKGELMPLTPQPLLDTGPLHSRIRVPCYMWLISADKARLFSSDAPVSRSMPAEQQTMLPDRPAPFLPAVYQPRLYFYLSIMLMRGTHRSYGYFQASSHHTDRRGLKTFNWFAFPFPFTWRHSEFEENHQRLDKKTVVKVDAQNTVVFKTVAVPRVTQIVGHWPTSHRERGGRLRTK